MSYANKEIPLKVVLFLLLDYFLTADFSVILIQREWLIKDLISKEIITKTAFLIKVNYIQMILKFNNTRIHFLKEKHFLSRLRLLSFLLL